jgi:hypothetical protein
LLTDRESLVIKARHFENCRLDVVEKEHTIFADSRKVGSLWFDMRPNTQFKYCVVVGMPGNQDESRHSQKKYFILAVQEQPHNGRYTRVGVGEVEACFVSKESDTGKLM